MIPRSSWRWALGLACLAVALVTLTPAHVPEAALARTPWWCLICGDQGVVDVLLNVLLFTPLGFTLRASGLPLRRCVAVGLLATLLIEVLQGFVIPGRDASLSDVLTNTLGAAAGAWVMPQTPRVFLPSPKLSGRITIGATILFVAQAVAAVVLFLPAPIPDAVYQVQWGQVFPGTVPFRGEIISAEAQGLPLEPGRLDSTRAFIQRLAALPTVVSTDVRGAPRVRARAQIVAVHDGNTNVITWFNQNRCDFEFRLRLAPAILRLNYPSVSTRLPCDLPTNLLHLEGQMSRRALSIVVSDVETGEEWRGALPNGPNLTWSYLIPGHRGYLQVQWQSALWVLVWASILAYFARFTLNPSLKVVPALALLVVLGLLPVVLGLTAVAWIEWAGALVGWVVGWGAAHRIRDKARAPSSAC